MKKATFYLYFLMADGLAAILAWIGYYMIRKHIEGQSFNGLWFTLGGSALVIACFWLVIFAMGGFYVDVLRKSRIRELLQLIVLNIAGVIALFLALLFDADTTNYTIQTYFRYLGIYFLVHLSITAIVKISVLTHIKKLIHNKIIRFQTIIIGNHQSAADIYRELQPINYYLGLHFVGYVCVEQDLKKHQMPELLPFLGYYKDLEAIAQQHNVEEAIIAVEPSEHQTIEFMLNTLEGQNIRISIIPDIYQILLGAVRINHVFGTPLITVRQQIMPIWQQVTKRIIDLVASFFVLLLASPLYIFVGIMTRLSSKGPIIFSQERIGKGGKPFNIYKFRSMYTDAEKAGPRLSSSHDPRITPWGLLMRKTRLDEIPQFFNVLIGDMSLVGPRPERAFFIKQIMQIAPHYRYLNRVRPGITSLGQVKFGYAENVAQMVRRLKYDIIYIENMSLAMDFRIIFYTIITVLKGSGK